MSFTCIICNKSFTTNGGLKRHINKKTPCVIVVLNNIAPSVNHKFKCNSCNHYFTSNQNLKKHIANTCQILKNKEKANNMQNEIIELKNTVNELKTMIKTTKIETQNNTNCNNVVNNIQINSFSNTDITTEHILNALLKELSAAAEYSKLPEIEKRKIGNSEKNNKLIASGLLEILDNVYADPNNKNAYLHKKNVAKVYEDGDWRIKTLEAVNRESFKIIIEMVDKIKSTISIPKKFGYEAQAGQIKETLNTLPQMYWNNISEILENSKFGLSVLLEANKQDIEKIQKEILDNDMKDNC
jgi:hypothetical protein